MEGGGVDSIIQELHDAALAVTVLNRRLLQTANTLDTSSAKRLHGCFVQSGNTLRRQSSVHQSVETNTEPPRCIINGPYLAPKCHSGVQALDGHYMTTYRIAHCCASPTSSPQCSPEFPQRTNRPSLGRGNFKMFDTWYTSPCDNVGWCERESLCKEPHQVMDAFVHSLRKYPISPEGESSEFVQKLLNHTQNKHSSKYSNDKYRDHSPPECLSPGTSMKNASKAETTLSRDFGSNTTNELRFKVHHMRGRCFDAYSNYSISRYRDLISDTYDYMDAPCHSKRTCPVKRTNCPSQRTCSSRNTGCCPYRRQNINISRGPCNQPQPGYFNEVKKYIRETIKQICEEKPHPTCPKMRSRYNRHKRKHHSPMVLNQETEEEIPSCSSPEPLTPEPSRASPPCAATPSDSDVCPSYPPVCKPRPPPPCVPPVCRPLPQKLEPTVKLTCPYCAKPLPCFCKILDVTESQTDLKDVIFDWLKELPISAADTPCNKSQRELLINKLAEDIKKLENNPDFDIKAQDAVKKCLDYLPIWYPSNPNDLDVFKNQITDDLLNRIGNYLITKPIRDIIRKKLGSLQYIQDFDMKKVIDKFKMNLTPLFVHPDQLKTKLTELILELPIANKNEALSSIVDGFYGEIAKILQIAKPEGVKDISDVELEEIAYEWVANSPEVLSKVEPEKIKNLVQKIYDTQNKHLSEQAEKGQMNRDIVEWIDSLLKSRNEIVDTNTKQNLARELIDQIMSAKATNQFNIDETNQSVDNKSMDPSKARKRWSQGPMLQSVTNEVRDVVKNIPGLDTNEKVDTVSHKIASLISKKLYELAINPSDVTNDIANVLEKETDISQTETEDFALAIVNKVKKMTSGEKRTSFQFKNAVLTEDLEKEVTEQVEKVFDEFHVSIDKSIENIVIDSLLDEIVRGPKEHTKEDIKSALHQAHLTDSLTESIADRLLNKSKEIEVSRPSISSNIIEQDFGSSTPRRIKTDLKFKRSSALSSIQKDDHDPFGLHTVEEATQHRENEKQYAIDIKGRIRDWIDDLPISSKEKSYIKPRVSDLTNVIIDRQKYLQIDPSISTSPQEESDNLKYQVFRWVSKIPEIEGNVEAVVDQTENLMHKLTEIFVPVMTSDNTGSDRQGYQSSPSPSGSKSPQSQSFSESSRSMGTGFAEPRKSILKHNLANAVKNFAKSLPLQIGAKEIPQANLDDLTIKILDMYPENNVITPNNKNKIGYELEKFLKQAPVNTNAVNIKDVTEDFINDIRQISKTHDGLSAGSKKAPQTSIEFAESAFSSYSTGTNTSSKVPHLKTTAVELFQSIDEWSENLPLKGDTPEEKEKMSSIKNKIANKLTQKVGELNMDPENLKDDFMFERLFEDEVENLVSEIPELKKDLPQLKNSLMGQVKEARRKIQQEMAGKEYKQQLRDALSKTIPLEPDLNEEEQTLFDILKHDVVDGFLNLHYADETFDTAAEHRKKLRAEIDKFIQKYLNTHPNAQIDTKTLNKQLYEALRSIPPPKKGTEGIRGEVELIRNIETCNDWAKKNNLFKDETPAEKLHKKKALAVLGTKIKEINKVKEHSPDFDYDDVLKKEINKWLTNTAAVDREDVGKITDELVTQLKDKKPIRHVDSTTQRTIGPEYYYSSPDLSQETRLNTQTPGGLSDSFGVPPTILSPAEQLYMEKIRQRNQAGYPDVEGVGFSAPRTEVGYSGFDNVGSGAPRPQVDYPGSDGVGAGPSRPQVDYPGSEGLGSGVQRTQLRHLGFESVGSGAPRTQTGYSGFDGVSSGAPRPQAGYPGFDGVGSGVQRTQLGYPGFEGVDSGTISTQAGYPGFDGVDSGTQRTQFEYPGFQSVGSGGPRTQAGYPSFDSVGSGAPRTQAGYPGLDGVDSGTQRTQLGYSGFESVGSGAPRTQPGYPSVDSVGSGAPRTQAGYTGFDGVDSGTQRIQLGYPGYQSVGSGAPRTQADYPGFDSVGSGAPRTQAGYVGTDGVSSGTQKTQLEYPGFESVGSGVPRTQAGYPGFDGVSSGAPKIQPGVNDVDYGTQAQQSIPGIDSQVGLTPRVIVKEFYGDPVGCKFYQMPGPCGNVPPCVEIPPCAKPPVFQSAPYTSDSSICPNPHKCTPHTESSFHAQKRPPKLHDPAPISNEASPPIPLSTSSQQNSQYEQNAFNQRTAHGPQKLRSQDNASFSQQGTTSGPRSVNHTKNTCHHQTYREPPPCPRMPPSYLCPKTSISCLNPCKRTYTDCTYRKPLKFPKYPCKTCSLKPSVTKRFFSPDNSNSDMSPCNTLPRAMPSRQQYNSNVCSKRRFENEQKCSEDDEDEDEEDDEDEDDIEDAIGEYNCKCKIVRSKGLGNKDRTKEILKKCARCCGNQCPYPSYCYFSP